MVISFFFQVGKFFFEFGDFDGGKLRRGYLRLGFLNLFLSWCWRSGDRFWCTTGCSRFCRDCWCRCFCCSSCRSWCFCSLCLRFELWKVRQGQIFFIWNELCTFVLFDVLLASLDSLLCLLIHRLQLSHSHKIDNCIFVFFNLFIGQSSPQIGFDKHIHVINVGRALEDFCAILNLQLVLLFLVVAERYVAKDGRLHLGNLFFEDTEIFVGNFENLCSILIIFDSIGVPAFFEFKLRLFFSSVNFSANFIKLRLKFRFFFLIDCCLGSLRLFFHRGSARLRFWCRLYTN